MIEWYSFQKHDGASGHMLQKAEKLLDSFPDVKTMGLDALLEIHHIHKYFENEIFLSNWTSEKKGAVYKPSQICCEWFNQGVLLLASYFIWPGRTDYILSFSLFDLEA